MANTLTIPGIKGTFAIGMTWRHEDAIPKAKYLRELSKQGGRWGVVRKTSAGTLQIGLCPPVQGVTSPKKLKALAAIIADAKPNPWMGFYKISEDLYWYIAVRDGQEIIPDGDMVGTIEDLLPIRERHMSYGRWTQVEGSLEDVAEIVRTIPKHPVLRDLQSRPWVVPVSSVAALTLVLVGGSLGWKKHQQDLELERQAQLQRQRAIQAALQAQKNVQPKILPWTQLPEPDAAFSACAKLWSKQPFGQDGWALDSWSCQIDTNAVTTQSMWVRDGGVAKDAPGQLTDANHSTSNESVPVYFGQSAPRASQIDVAQRAAWTLAQMYGLKLKMDLPQAKASLPGAADKQTLSADPWIMIPVEFKLEASPYDFGLGQAFDAVPALRVTTVSWAPTDGWTIKGSIYAAHALPADVSGEGR